MTHIFISYAKKDTRPLAQDIRAALTQLSGVTAWMDETLRPGKSWAAQIQTEIRRCDLMIVLISEDVNRDPDGEKGISFVINEIEYAQRLRKPIIPVLAQLTDPPVQIVSLQFVDFTSDQAAAMQRLLREVGHHAENTPPTSTTPAFDKLQLAPARKSPSKRRMFVGIGLVALLAIIVTASYLLNQNSSNSNLHNRDWTPTTETFDGVDMALVPVGCFEMGNDIQAEVWDGERFVLGVPDGKRVCFDTPFWIDKTEVTNAQFASLNGSAELPSVNTEANHPREYITWIEATEFCELRGGRLPTEAEWEYAARGKDNWFYPWGNDFIGENVVYKENSNSSAEVGSRPNGASWVGALDMVGNVFEWVSTIFDEDKFPYPYDLYDGRENRDDLESPRVERGGSWYFSDPFVVRAATRDWVEPTKRYDDLGFRCARNNT